MARTGKRSRSLIPLAGFAAAALVYVASLLVSGSQLLHQADLEANGHRIGFWETSQALTEAQRLRAELYRAQQLDDDGAELALRFEILWSRLQLLDAGREGAVTYPAIEQVRAALPGIFARLGRIEALLPAVTAGSAAAFAQAEELAAATILELAEAHRTLNQDRQLTAEAASLGLRRLQATFAISTLGLVASMALLCGLLFSLWRRAQRTLASAAAAEDRARRSERLLRVVVDALPVMVSAHDRNGRVTLANRALAAFRGTTADGLLGRRPSDAGGEARDIAAALAARAQLPFREIEAEGSDGTRRTLLTTVAPVREDGGAISAVVRIGVDITERKAAEEQIRYMAERDSLTGLANRMLFTRALNSALADGTPVALHLLDLDNFKDVNDSLGHAAGDALLLTATGRMRRCLGPRDLLARLGGDEFAVIQSGLRSEAEAEETAARLVRALTAPYGIDGASVQAGASIGIAIAPTDGADGLALLQRADIALYRAKGAGRGRALRFSAAMAAEQTERRLLEVEVKQALADRAFEFDYQPKFRVADLRFAGCEALLRWRHPVRGAVPPDVFIPAAEAAGLSLKLVRQTLRMALRQQAIWRAEGLDVPVAVNVSARHIVSGQAAALVREALELEEGRADRLEVEVTEDVFIRDPGAAAATLSGLRDIGVRLALDDFGTGYSSLGYLQQLPFDVIKLDRTFVAGLGTSTRTERIVDAVVRIAHGLGASLVAEGVETVEQLARLREIGCDEVQGFLLGRPMPAKALALLASSAPPPEVARNAAAGEALTSAA